MTSSQSRATVSKRSALTRSLSRPARDAVGHLVELDGDAVVPGPAANDVAPAAGPDLVVAAAARDDVRSAAAVDEVGRGGAVQPVRSVGPVERGGRREAGRQAERRGTRHGD